MRWIRENTPADATFAVNTHFWLPRTPHGTDAGYWIPYFSERQTTVGAMLLHLGAPDYVSKIVGMSQKVEDLQTDASVLKDLYALDVDYVYIGQRGDFSGPGLNAERLTAAENAQLVYEDGAVFIFRIEAP
jgi:hypothetical protein